MSGYELAVAIRMEPPAAAGPTSGGDANVEVGIHRSNPSVDVPVELLLGDRALASCPLPRRLVLVFVIQTKVHCPQHHVEALHHDVIMGSDIRNLFGVDLDVATKC
jgi:hypothetical protein